MANLYYDTVANGAAATNSGSRDDPAGPFLYYVGAGNASTGATALSPIGSNAAATCTLNGTAVNPAGITITSPGSNYVAGNTIVVFSAPSSGTTATGSPVISNGQITGITMSNNGSGYTAAPTITFYVNLFSIGTMDLSAIQSSGTPNSTRDSMYIANATNASSRKIFWIAGVDNTAKTIQLDSANYPTGAVSGSTWAIGGRQSAIGSLNPTAGAGDTIYLNADVSSSTGTTISLGAGDNVSGYCRLIGKSGTRPKVTCTSSSGSCISPGANTWIENIELIQSASSGTANAVANNGSGNVTLYNVKISQARGNGVGNATSGGATKIINCEITGCLLDGVNITNSGQAFITGCYIHGNGGNGISDTSSNPNMTVLNNIIYNNSGRGIYFSYAATQNTNANIFIFGNTIVANVMTGIEWANFGSASHLFNNILQDNGSNAGTFNVLFPSTAIEYNGVHGNNIFNKSINGNNVSGLTLTGTESTSNPQLTNPSANDFSLGATSAARASGFPSGFLGVASSNYRDIGALQHQDSGGGGGSSGVIVVGLIS